MGLRFSAGYFKTFAGFKLIITNIINLNAALYGVLKGRDAQLLVQRVNTVFN